MSDTFPPMDENGDFGLDKPGIHESITLTANQVEALNRMYSSIAVHDPEGRLIGFFSGSRLARPGSEAFELHEIARDPSPPQDSDDMWEELRKNNPQLDAYLREREEEDENEPDDLDEDSDDESDDPPAEAA